MTTSVSSILREMDAQKSYTVSLDGSKKREPTGSVSVLRQRSREERDEIRRRASTIMITGRLRWFQDEWDMLDPLGEPGAFGIAYSCVTKTDKTRTLFAVKQINKARFYHIDRESRMEILDKMRNEINIQKDLDHPNIVTLYDVYEDRNYIHLVMDYLSGGELFERICEKESLSEKEAANITKQILNALEYMQKRDICHFDLKPDNILFENKSDDSPIKIIDFGMAHVVPRMQKLKQLVGTPYYLAPEVLEGDYNRAADIWSVGVILFCMLFGFPPFYVDHSSLKVGQSEDDCVFEMIKKGFTPETLPGYGPWFPEDIPGVSDHAKNLIASMLRTDVTQRLTVKECLDHPWIRGEVGESQIPTTVLSSLMNFRGTCKFKVVISQLFAKSMNPHRYAQTLEVFKRWDIDGDGEITLEEFRNGMKQTTHLSDTQIDEVFQHLDQDDNRTITVDELIVSSAFDALVAADERLYDLFVKLDENGDGKLDADELRKAMGEIGIDDTEIGRAESILKEIDIDGDGEIDYEEFLRALHPAFNELAADDIAPVRSHRYTFSSSKYRTFLSRAKKFDLMELNRNPQKVFQTIERLPESPDPLPKEVRPNPIPHKMSSIEEDQEKDYSSKQSSTPHTGSKEETQEGNTLVDQLAQEDTTPVGHENNKSRPTQRITDLSSIDIPPGTPVAGRKGNSDDDERAFLRPSPRDREDTLDGDHLEQNIKVPHSRCCILM